MRLFININSVLASWLYGLSNRLKALADRLDGETSPTESPLRWSETFTTVEHMREFVSLTQGFVSLGETFPFGSGELSGYIDASPRDIAHALEFLDARADIEDTTVLRYAIASTGIGTATRVIIDATGEEINTTNYDLW